MVRVPAAQHSSLCWSRSSRWWVWCRMMSASEEPSGGVDLAATAAASTFSRSSSCGRNAEKDRCQRRYHSYSTIGIADHAFVVPPTHPLPGEYFTVAEGRRPVYDDGEAANPLSTVFVSDEIVGTIKSSPSDFVVREIAPAHRCATAGAVEASAAAGGVTDLIPGGVLQSFRVADLVDAEKVLAQDQQGDSLNEQQDMSKRAFIQRMEEPLPSKRRENRSSAVKLAAPSSDASDDNVKRSSTTVPDRRVDQVNEGSTEVSTSLSIRPKRLATATIDPLTALKRQLDHTREGSDEWMRRLASLSERAVNGLRHDEATSVDKSGGEASASQHVVSFHLVPRPFCSTSGEADEDSSQCVPLDRGTFHQAIRYAFPMLLAESTVDERSMQECHDQQGERDETAASDSASYRVTVIPDPMFFSLGPYLHEPHVDLPRLYSYYKGSAKAMEPNNCRADDDPGLVLRLKPDLPRSERRHVHHTIETTSKQNLITTTRTNASPEAMAAIVVQWSKIAQRRLAKRISNQSRKKQRRAASGDSQRPEQAPLPKDGTHADREQSSPTKVNPHSFFVLKKTGIEHLRAQQCLADLLKCRQADLGLAGIKDTVATTFQFCTVRNYDAGRLMRTLQQRPLKSYGSPGSGIEIGNVRAVNWLINKGGLDGNRFEIVLRDVRRVHVDLDASDGSARELFVPCNIDHIASRINSVVRSGFCNFYGEQRVGIPGEASVVGVRGFDVGRSMLQQNFGDAVNKIMTGRTVIRDFDNREPEEIQKVRNVWKDTGGDPHRTWKVLPRGSSMARERLILKGLKRYGDPLLAIRCLHFHERMFWVSAYQSYIWNTMTSERIRRYGPTVVVGDLIESVDDGCVAIVTTESLQNPGYRFEDVVLPLPGYDVLYPTNEIGEQYRALLERDGVSFRKDAQPEGTAKGSYRRLVSRAYNVSFDVVTPSSDEKGLDIKLRFDLPTGSYATMFLRELMFTTVVRNHQNAGADGDE